MAVMETIEDFKDSIGDKGFYIILGVIGLAFVYFAKTGSTQNSSTLVDATEVSNYPSVSANADVVIDSVNQSAESRQQELMSAIGSTNDYIQSAKDTLSGKIDTVSSGITNLQNTSDNIYSGVSGIQNSVNNIQSGVNNVQNNMISKDYLDYQNYKLFVGNKQAQGINWGEGFKNGKVDYSNFANWQADMRG